MYFFRKALLISAALILLSPGVTLAAEHSWDDGGVQPDTGYPGGHKPDDTDSVAGGAQPDQDPPPVPVTPPPPPPPPPTHGNWTAKILSNGQAWISPGAPLVLRQMIQAGNKIVGKPYLWGGGHKSWNSRGYDCSGAVSYVLHGGLLTDWPMTSGDMMSWGLPGAGKWVTIYTRANHVFIHIAGIRMDTSWVDDPSGRHGVRWRPLRSHHKGFRVRHPIGL